MNLQEEKILLDKLTTELLNNIPDNYSAIALSTENLNPIFQYE